MTDTTQSKENLQKYEKVFHNSLHYGFVNRDQIEFYQNQFDVIRPSISSTLEFVDNYDFGDEQDNIRIYAVACLPFILAKFDIENPDIEDRAFKNKTLDWLNYIKHNKMMTNHHIHSITSDDSITVIQDDLLDKQIAIYEWMLSGRISKKREWWSLVLQFQYLARSVDIAWKSTKMKLDFLYIFFSLFNKDVNPDSIEKQMLIASRKNGLMAYSEEHIQKVLALPENTFTKEELKNEILNPLKDLLL